MLKGIEALCTTFLLCLAVLAVLIASWLFGLTREAVRGFWPQDRPPSDLAVLLVSIRTAFEVTAVTPVNSPCC